MSARVGAPPPPDHGRADGRAAPPAPGGYSYISTLVTCARPLKSFAFSCLSKIFSKLSCFCRRKERAPHGPPEAPIPPVNLRGKTAQEVIRLHREDPKGITHTFLDFFIREEEAAEDLLVQIAKQVKGMVAQQSKEEIAGGIINFLQSLAFRNELYTFKECLETLDFPEGMGSGEVQEKSRTLLEAINRFEVTALTVIWNQRNPFRLVQKTLKKKIESLLGKSDLAYLRYEKVFQPVVNDAIAFIRALLDLRDSNPTLLEPYPDLQAILVKFEALLTSVELHPDRLWRTCARITNVFL